MSTPAQDAGCCGAFTKDACITPPCPCNLSAWTEEELLQLEYSALGIQLLRARTFSAQDLKDR